MRLLLDTHILIWSQSDPARLGPALDVLKDPDNELVVSAISAWEITIKIGTGKLVLPEPVDVWWPSRVGAIGATAVAMEAADALAVASLPPLHRDPFDRVLVAQSRRRGMTLMTADAAVWDYGGDLLRVA